jgi:hypothetical protein
MYSGKIAVPPGGGGIRKINNWQDDNHARVHLCLVSKQKRNNSAKRPTTYGQEINKTKIQVEKKDQ